MRVPFGATYREMPVRVDRDMSSTTQLSGALLRGDVKKNVAAIHVSGKLTLLQRKLSNVLLLNAYDIESRTNISNHASRW